MIPDDLALFLTLEELDASSKTFSIALSNLSKKIDNTNPGSPPHDLARRERAVLLGVMQKVTELQLSVDQAA